MLTVFVQIVTIISLLTFTGLAIASFVILSKLFIQIKYKNYLMENLVQNMSLFVKQSYKLNNELLTKKATDISNIKNDIQNCKTESTSESFTNTNDQADTVLLNNSSNCVQESS